MRDPSTHIFWETAGLISGLLIMTYAYHMIKRERSKRFGDIWHHLLIGLIGLVTAIVDGILFLPSWL